MESSENINDWSSGSKMVVSTLEDWSKPGDLGIREGHLQQIYCTEGGQKDTKGQCRVIVSVFISFQS